MKIALSLFIVLNTTVALATEVNLFTPTGSVKQITQVRAQFTGDMVAMGDPRVRKNPFDVKCGGHEAVKKSAAKAKPEVKVPQYQTRWIDARNWSLDFADPLPAGVKCSFEISKDAKDLAGAALTGTSAFNFSTSGPALLAVAPGYGSVEPEQYFVLQLDGLIDEKSLESIAYFESAALPDKINVRVINGPERDAAIRAAIKINWEWDSLRKYADLNQPVETIDALKNFVVIAGTRRFPEGAKLSLRWPKGILSASGVPVEDEQNFDFEVLPIFEAKFTCERVNSDRGCNPILNMRIAFTNRVKLALLKGTVLKGTSGGTWTPVELKSGDQNKNDTASAGGPKHTKHFNVITNFEDAEVDSLTFQGPFPPSAGYTLEIPKGIRDEIGRALENEKSYPLSIATDDFSPLVKFSATFGLLERDAEPLLPVSVRKVESPVAGHTTSIDAKDFVLGSNSKPAAIIEWLKNLEKKDYNYERRGSPLLSSTQGKAFSVPRPNIKDDFELVGIPLKTPGLHIVELESPALGQALLGSGTMYVASGALVTNLSVHLKKGRESSLVWVTQLSDAKPVAGAEVGLYSDSGCEIAKGKTDANGMWKVPAGFSVCLSNGNEYQPVYAFAKQGDDFSFVSSQWSKGIEEYRFNMRREYEAQDWGPAIVHSIADRAIVKAGESVHLKHVLREHTGGGFRTVAKLHLPKHVLIVHTGSRKTYSFPFVYDAATGTALTTFQVPKDASLGLYEVYLSRKDKKKSSTEEDEGGGGEDDFDWSAKSSGQFLVSEYRLPLMESHVLVRGDTLVQPKDVTVDLSASYLSGGPAANLKTKVRATVNAENFSPDVPGASEFTFFSDPVRVGVVDQEERVQPVKDFLFTEDLTLDKTGGGSAVIHDIPAVKQIKSLRVEMEYRDPNGEVKTSSAQKMLFPAQTIVGLRTESWLAQPGKVGAFGIITNEKGKPLPGHAYTVHAYRREYITHRKRLVGGFYAFDSQIKTSALGEICKGSSDEFGRFHCVGKSLPSGSIVLQAETSDDLGRGTVASVDVSVFADDEEQWWAPSDSDRIDILPERTQYEPGDNAKFVVQSPFPKSTLLVTVEREGILEAFTKEITRDQSVVEVPIKGSYAPNVFVSIIALRGRVGDPKPTALVDLARPSMKLGYSELKVGWKDHQLNVQVASDKKRYHTRDKVQVKIHVVAANGQKLPPGAEVAVVAFDEALNRLRKNWSTDLLSSMMGQRNLAVDTASAQNQVIGKRHFGAKAKAPGGGGGAANGDEGARELFQPVLVWEPHLKLNANGDAQTTVSLNDSITRFQIEAVAQAGMEYFGNGSTKIEASKDLIIYSGFAPVVRDGDKIKNQLTLRNTTDHSMQVKLQVKCPQISTIPQLEPQTLAAGEAKTFVIDLDVPSGVRELNFELDAKDTSTGASDVMKTKLRVEEAVPAQVLQATLLQIEKSAVIPVQQPSDAIPGRGGLEVSAQRSLVAGLSGVQSYMEDYPYSCLEQKTSKAIALENKEEIQKVIEQLPGYFDALGLLKFFPVSLCGSPQLSHYVLDILDENHYDLPASTRDRAVLGLENWLNGKQSCHTWWDEVVRDNFKDQERILAIETLARYEDFDESWLSTVTITPNLWQTSTVVAWLKILDREKKIVGREQKMKDAEMILRSRVNVQGSMLNLQGQLAWEAGWHLFTSNDQEALDVFSVAIDHSSWANDIGRMARGVVARLKKGIWDTTMANAWGVTELRRFSAKFEKETVSGKTIAQTKDALVDFDWAKPSKPLFKHMPWPEGSLTAKSDVTITQQGKGKPWALLRTTSAIPLKAPLEMGYSIERKVTFIDQKKKGVWTTGDVANVELIVHAKSDQPWVVVRDPIPAGSSILGAGLEDTSAILDREPKAGASDVSAWPTEFEEKSLSNFTAYAAYLPRGAYRLNYRVRLNSVGTLRLPPTRVEAMYSPEAFGELPNADWQVDSE